MINHFLTIHDLGLFGFASRIASIIGIAMMGFQTALTPLIYKNFHLPETPTKLAKIFRLFMAFALLLTAGIALFSNDIIHLMATEEYLIAATTTSLLAPAILLSQMYVFFPGISITKKPNTFFI